MESGGVLSPPLTLMSAANRRSAVTGPYQARAARGFD